MKIRFDIWVWVVVFFVPLLFVTCEKEADKPKGDNKVEITSTTTSAVEYFSTNVSATLVRNPGNTIDDHGFCYGTAPGPDITGSKKSLGRPTGTGNLNFSSELTGLTDNTKYYLRAYATLATGTVYGSQKEVTTLKAGKPRIITSVLSDITLTSAICGGTIESDSGYAVTASGICWDTDNQFNENQCLGKNNNTSGSTTFSLTISGLNDGTTYFVKAWASNQKGTSYGETRPFSSATVTIPTVSTNAITNPTANSATCSGNVTNDGGANVTARGVCWNTTGNPTLQNCINFTTNGNGTGSFTSNITGIAAPAEYFVKAYATNSEGTAYGNQVDFTTVPWSCGAILSITHTAGAIAPVNKTVNYGTVQTNLTGSNKCWITQNLGADRQATSATDATESSAGWYWQFNRKQGYKHDGSTRTPNTIWITSINENSDWLPANDPCNLLLGSGWRLPTSTEWQTADNTGGWDNYNETFASVLKLHAAGYLVNSDGSLGYRGSYGFYWSSSQYGSGNGHNLNFNSGNSSMSNYRKANGFSTRCLRD